MMRENERLYWEVLNSWHTAMYNYVVRLAQELHTPEILEDSELMDAILVVDEYPFSVAAEYGTLYEQRPTQAELNRNLDAKVRALRILLAYGWPFATAATMLEQSITEPFRRRWLRWYMLEFNPDR